MSRVMYPLSFMSVYTTQSMSVVGGVVVIVEKVKYLFLWLRNFPIP